MHCWREQLPALAAAGCRAVAPSQRGYSPGARPDSTVYSNYAFDHLVADAMAIANACGGGDRRFHLVGHDWGGSLAWAIADRTPERLASITILSRAPIAFNARSTCGWRRRDATAHHRGFWRPTRCEPAADDVRGARATTGHGVPREATERHLAVIGNEAAMAAALAWYRARDTHHKPVGNTVVPTLYIWGDADDTVGRAAAEGTAEFVSAPYRFAVLPGGGHFVADQFPEEVNALLLDHLAKHPT